MSAVPALSRQLMLPAASGCRAGLQFWAGYSFKQPDVVRRWMWGQVSTPRWAKRVRGPLCLDNGAFPAWRDKRELSGADQLAAMLELAPLAPAMVVACDIVAKGRQSWMRTLWSLRSLELSFPAARILLPLQEGVDIDAAIATAERIGGGLFIGGATTRWKIATAHAVRRRTDAFVHVARLTTPEDIWPIYGVADSFDTTTFSRSQHANVAKRERVWHAIEPMLAPPPWAAHVRLRERL